MTRIIFTLFLFLCYNLPAEEIYMQSLSEKCEFKSKQTEKTKSNFAVIYRSYLKPVRENDYQNYEEPDLFDAELLKWLKEI